MPRAFISWPIRLAACRSISKLRVAMISRTAESGASTTPCAEREATRGAGESVLLVEDEPAALDRRLVPFGDPAALTDAVCAALDHPWDRDRIAEVGGRRTWQQVARECVDVFESVLDR